MYYFIYNTLAKVKSNNIFKKPLTRTARVSKIDNDGKSVSQCSVDKRSKHSISKHSKQSRQSKQSKKSAKQSIPKTINSSCDFTFSPPEEKKRSGSKEGKKKRVKWSEKDYERYVKVVRRHGKDYSRLELVLKDKSVVDIKKFTKVLIKQIKSMKGHPEEDLLD